MKVVEQLKSMSEERFLAIYQALTHEGFGPMDREVAASLKFRLPAVKRLPMEQRARRARALLQRASNAQAIYELFGTYLMTQCKELVTGFLDATGVPHEEGMVRDLDAAPPAADKLGAALTDLDQRFAPEDVTLYLSMAAQQWPTVPELESAWRLRT